MPASGSASSSSQAQSMPQFACVLEVRIRGCTLPSLVPEALAATCPNLHTLHLQNCVLEDIQHESGRKQNSNQNRAASGNSGSSSSSSTVRGHSDTYVAQQLHTLIVDNVCAPQLCSLPTGNTRHTRSMQQAASFAEQLRHSIPNVRCLMLPGEDPNINFIALLGPQLNELHLRQLQHISALNQYDGCKQLQQLQTLVVPQVKIPSDADMELLLSMPNLKHIDMDSIDGLTADYSSRACKWQYLQLQQYQQPLMHVDTLLQLPLYSLTQPLTLGHRCMRWLRVGLPDKIDPTAFVQVERLAQRLTECGVRLHTPLLCWSGHLRDQEEITPLRLGAHLVPSFTAMATAYGPHSKVQLELMVLDKAMLQALAAVYKDSLQLLVLRFVNFDADTRHAWPAVLSSMPGLKKVELIHCWETYGEIEDLVELIRCLALAVAQQPDQRCIVVTCFGKPFNHSRDVVKRLMEDAPEQLSGVQLVAKEYHLYEIGLDHVFNSSEVHIKRKPVS